MYSSWRILVVTLVALLLVRGAGAGDRFDAARARETLLAELNDRYLAGDNERVITVLRDSLPDAEFTPRLRNLLGLALAAEGRHREAVTAYEKGLRGGGEALFELHVNLALSLQALGIGGRAMAEFQRAAEIAPQELEARLALGEGYIDYRRYALARSELEAASELAPRDPRVIRQRARLADATGDRESSEELWRVLEESVPDADTARRLGELSAAEDPPAAIEWYRRCAERDSTAGDCSAALGSLLLGQGEDVEALPWLCRAESAGVSSPELVHNLLLVYQRSARLDSLEAVVRRHPPQRADSWGIVALARRSEGRIPEALEAAERAHALDPEDPDLGNILAVLLHESGRTAEARELWRRILETHPDHPQARANLDESH